jgi:hypothetical protein
MSKKILIGLCLIQILVLIKTAACAQNKAFHSLKAPDTSVNAPTPKPVSKPAKVNSSELVIRNSFESADETAKPASLSLTMPDGKKGSYLVDLGLEYSFSEEILTGNKLSGHSFAPFLVFKRNTEIDQPQNTSKGGLQYQWSFGKSTSELNHVNYLNFTAQYVRDIADSSHSLLATAYYSYLSNNIADPSKVFINNYHMIGKSDLFYLLAFNAGLEAQNIWLTSGGKTGFQGRFMGDASASIAWRHPRKGQKTKNSYAWPKQFELSAEYTARYAIVNTGDAFDRWLPLFKPSLSWYPLLNDKFSIALSYNNGSDPTAGLPSQKFWTFAIQFQK